MQQPFDQSQVDQLIKALECSDTIDALNQLKSTGIGKNGWLTQAFKQLRDIDPNQRAKIAAVLNDAKSLIQSAYDARRSALADQALQEALGQSGFDLSLPGRSTARGTLHPLTQTLQSILGIFSEFGFESVQGPEIDTPENNFTNLNIPEHHPARAMHDTFYLKGGQLLLRTHTSSVWFHALAQRQPPLQIVAHGPVYRCETLDRTHLPMFHQVEGLVLKERATLVELKSVMVAFLERFFDRTLHYRFRSSYFPFTEPSIEIDIQSEGRWLEVLGCGMVHPNVIANAGYDPDHITGWAFGCGLERFAMLKYGIDDIRLFYQNPLEFLEQF